MSGNSWDDSRALQGKGVGRRPQREAPRDRASPTAKKRGDGLEPPPGELGRPPAGTAARRAANGSLPSAFTGAGTRPAALRTVSATSMYGSRRTLGFPPGRRHLGTGSPSRRPPSAGCAGRRPAFQAVPALLHNRRYAVARPSGPRCRCKHRPSSPGGGSLASGPISMVGIPAGLRFHSNWAAWVLPQAVNPGVSLRDST